MCEYNWRVYDGTTPADAVEGGKDANGVTFYIALVHLKLVNEKLAGMIIPQHPNRLHQLLRHRPKREKRRVHRGQGIRVSANGPLLFLFLSF
jgi:hypothetical protein